MQLESPPPKSPPPKRLSRAPGFAKGPLGGPGAPPAARQSWFRGGRWVRPNTRSGGGAAVPTSAAWGWRWLAARRGVQLGLLALFIGGARAGWPGVQGTLAASQWFGAVPLVDPLVALQSLLAGHALAGTALLSAGLLALAYALTAGRLYCGWVCPLNLVTDAAAGLRRLFGWHGPGPLRLHRRLRHAVLAAALLASVVLGTVAWELVNPITLGQRALVFGNWGSAAPPALAGASLEGVAATLAALPTGLWAVVAVFVFDLLLLRHGWCGHLCPVGAFYGLLGRLGRWATRRGVVVVAQRAEACTRCGDCFAICPEPQVIAPVLRDQAVSRAITDDACLRCGRCLDHCGEAVFTLRWQGPRAPAQPT